jgi:hypothetical protein
MSEGDVPRLRVVRGRATEEETAAVVTVLMARLASRERAAAAARSRGAQQARSAWCDKSSLLRSPVTPGPGAWRASAMPGY